MWPTHARLLERRSRALPLPLSAEYGLANRIQHPRNVYVREDAILPRLDAWLGRLFDPDNLDATVAALAAADGDDTARARIECAERTLADCKQRLARYRAALEAGTDPAVIARWSAEVQAEQARAENDLRRARQAYTPPPSRDELENLIRQAGDLVTILAEADAADRRGLYAALGLRLTYEPDREGWWWSTAQTVSAWAMVRVGGGI